METRSERQVALVELGEDLRARALALSDDVNASYLLVHELIAPALRKDTELGSRVALKDALMTKLTQRVTSGTIAHRVMP